MSNITLEENKVYNAIPKKTSFIDDVRKNFFLYLLVLPGVLYFIVFKYLPMIGIIIAFEDYNFVKGILGSKFVGLKNFEFFFSSNDWVQVTFNTVYLNILFIITGLICSIGIALVLSEISGKLFIKITQSIVILPNFISWTLAGMFSISLLNTDYGFINITLQALNHNGVNFFSRPELWPAILVFLRIWKGAGFGSVIYLAAIAGIDQEIYQAAKIDGANRMQCVRWITLPQLKTTAILLTILGIGGIFHGDFGMIYALVGDNSFLYPTTDVIDTYVYRQLRTMGDVSMSAAVGLYQSVVGFCIVLVTNTLAKKFEPDSAIF